MEASLTVIMSVQEARECIAKINSNLTNTRALILDLYERKGWETLGYKTWEKCVVSEFKDKERYLYYQLAAAKTEKNLTESHCTIVQCAGEIPETHLPPKQQQEVWQQAVEAAPEGKVTARHVENVIAGLPMARPEENIIEEEFPNGEG